MNKNHLFHIRLFAVFAGLLMAWLIYVNVTGRYIFGSNKSEQWSSKGPGYHK